MTAATLAGRIPQAIDAALIARAQGVCDRAAGLPLARENDEVTGALAELAGALRFYRRIAAGQLSPVAAYSLVASRPEAQWLPLALRMAAEDAAAEAEEVVKVITEELGDGIAAGVRGEGEGQ